MKRAMVFRNYAGLTVAFITALPGVAQGGSWFAAHLSFDATDAPMGGTVTATLTATWGHGHGAGAYLAAVSIDLIASDPSVYSVIDVSPVPWNNPAIGFDGLGVASGADVLGIQASQFSLIPPIDSSNPVQIFSFALQRVGTGSLSYSARVHGDEDGAFYLGGTFGHLPTPPFGPEYMTSDTLLGTPSPGVLGVLGAGVVLAGRRRRVG